MNNILKRLQKENKRTFWQTGAFRNGSQKVRMAWITQRLNELNDLKLFNKYLEE